MTSKADDLVKHLAALTQRFAGLAPKLARAAQELQGSGTLPAEPLSEELAAARAEFVNLRSSVLDAARALAVAAPAQAELVSLSALEGVITAMAEAVTSEAKRTTAAEARRRVLAVLDRIMTINHVDDPNFAALLDCQAKAREIRAAVLDPTRAPAESAAAVMGSTPRAAPAARPRAAGDGGRSVAAAGGGTGGGRRSRDARRGRPVVGLGVGPLDELEGHDRLQGGGQARAVEVRLSPQRPDPAVHGLRGRAPRVRLLDPARLPRDAEPRHRDEGAQQPEGVHAGQGRSCAVGRRAPVQLPARRGPAGRAVP